MRVKIMYYLNYESLDFSSDFMFGRIVSTDMNICKAILEMTLQKKILTIRLAQTQKTIDLRYDAKSIRLDVYAEGTDAVYDVEMQVANPRNLPQRSRYYQGAMDLNLIQRGGEYGQLRPSYVIFICRFDPFGAGLYQYSFENTCREARGILLGDGAYKIFLNTKGSAGQVSSQLKELLCYIERREFPASPQGQVLIRQIEAALAAARNNRDWRKDYMTLEMLKNECRAEGRAEGRNEFLRQLVSKKLAKGESAAQIAGEVEETLEAVQEIIDDLKRRG